MNEDFAVLLGFLFGFTGFLNITAKYFKKYWTSEKVIRNPFTYYVLAFNLLITASLPIALVLEFGTSHDSAYKTFSFYCKHYPHIVIYPSLFFGFAGLFIFRATLIRWTYSKRAVIIRIALAASGAFIATYYEATGGPIMLFEFNIEAQTATVQFQAPEVRKKAGLVGLDDAFTTPMASQISDALATSNGENKIAKTIRNYDAWNKLNVDWKSNSRIFYLLIFWYMIFVMLMGFSLLAKEHSNSTEKKPLNTMTSINLVGGLIVFLMWTPFRAFYNHHTKIPIFGSEITDNFLGNSSSYNALGLTASETAPLIFYITFIGFFLLRGTSISRKASVLIFTIIGLLIISCSMYLAVAQPDVFSSIYGLHSDIKFVAFRVIFFFIVILLTYDFISSRYDRSYQKYSE